MPLPRFHYSKNWESAADFPTHEYSEAQVRKDLMSLFTEWETYLNQTLLPVLESGGYTTGDSSSGAASGGETGAFLPLSGGQMAGPLLLYRSPTYSMEAATKTYVDANAQLYQQIINNTITEIQTSIGDIQDQIGEIADGDGGARIVVDPDKIEAVVENSLGDISQITMTADQIRALVRDALGNEASLTMTAEEIEAYVMDALGNISRLIMTSDAIAALVRDITGNAAAFSMTAEEIQALIEDNLGRFSQIVQTSTEIKGKVEDELGNSGVLSLTAEQVEALVTDLLGQYGQLVVASDTVKAVVSDNLNAEAVWELLKDRITAQVRDAVTSATLTLTPDEIRASVADCLGRLAVLALSVDSIEARLRGTLGESAIGMTEEQIEAYVSDLKGQIAKLLITSNAISAMVEDAAGNIASSTLTPEGLETAVSDAAGNISTSSQTATAITAAVTSAVSAAGVTMTAEEIQALIADINGRITQITANAQGIKAAVKDEFNQEALIQMLSDRITAEVRNAVSSATVNITPEGVSSVVSDTFGARVSAIEQTLGNISLGVSTLTENGEVYSRLKLSIGPNDVYGLIKMDGNVDVSGQLSAEALYSRYGEVADLTVDKLTTSRRIVKYLAGDTSDDNFIRIHQQVLEFVAGIAGSGTAQATNPDGMPLYWPMDVSGLALGGDGYPVHEGNRVFTTTTVTAYPVMVFQYTEQVKRCIRFEQGANGIYAPIDIFGAGNASGTNKGYLEKGTEGLELRYVTPEARTIGMKMTTDGYVDITGLRRTAALNFSSWDSGSFSEAIEGGRSRSYAVTFNQDGAPISITDTATGFSMTITW